MTRLALASVFVCGLAWGQAPPAAPAPSSPAPAPAAPAGTPDKETTPPQPAPVNLRLRDLEQRVEALKEQAWRVKARVGMLKEAVLGGGIGARATILHENKMGGSFRLARVIYALDGQQIFARIDEDTSKLHDLKSIEIFSGPISPGNHTLSVVLEYRGQGYGVFSYLKQYKFTVKSSHTFTATEGKETRLTVLGYEKGGITTQLKDRPAVEFKVNVVSEKPEGAASPPAAAAK
jgi:hypothetical protein